MYTTLLKESPGSTDLGKVWVKTIKAIYAYCIVNQRAFVFCLNGIRTLVQRITFIFSINGGVNFGPFTTTNVLSCKNDDKR